MSKAVEQIGAEEGMKTRVYKCSLGFDTIGKGYCLDKNPLKLSEFELKDMRENGCSEAKATLLLTRMVEELTDSLDKHIDFYSELDAPRRDVLTNMAYQLGVSGVLKFKGALAAIKHSKYELAAKEMLDSVWARQTPNRAKRLAKQMETGEYA
jgi:lysozyme